MTIRSHAIAAMTYEHFIGKDYAEHFDEAYDVIRERGYGLRSFGFLPFISYDFWNFDYGNPVKLDLKRDPPLPYGNFENPIKECLMVIGLNLILLQIKKITHLL